ncbi:3-oxoacyl-[acyl-carrier-protein] reductase FabG [Clostridium pasteurianum DSM 525 = ATCC 6013]|uniref:3-oxoacyl-[acyl-carrier-protein] reductase FabG n=1 Tax=Clostridium pasteurianum DSM 525 = ATCC 6013 TaxID=1262449 RepID=A0A0H3J1P6_CLOPA|nr:SDR family oxidoreductase [Clostridium pasteurianum]AJA47334.1 3-oxoacyl-[acyl-carrier-protein] reductase FabG [Clostridium pasteurianum DSM 525 = ATCC 6013]AJA51322.1 3-oxoacyl-[acyl-carrier-protein] reductase FabG [Clostridium pasteurianum DSM 525 = ATCC 6013]AOZ74669.1 short-chain dehydrogenase [Clostridium pasteurianum DSM 525 = ATCC 6013]AOZ78466.1 short-chain dehydrogenase [Clostridium pasteurianum]ELP58671.1 putative short-chain dehydrogenase [Clostridium pasteurianum DSM 525 = ATCC 
MKTSDTVLITGASSGIGFELAKVFASHTYNIVLVSRSVEKMKKLAKELTNKYKIKVHVIAQDLSKTGAAQELFHEVIDRNLQVDILVNNAGIGAVGLFHHMKMEKDIEMLQLNIVTLTEITKLFSKKMIERGYGKILNVASTGSFAPGPFIAVYYATKAYVLSFSEAIYRELKPYNITVSTLCPGATRTNFAKSAGRKNSSIAMMPDKVARIAYKGLKNNKKLIIPGLANKILVMLPRNFISNMVFKYQKKLAKLSK